jgi:hypothetical protein
VPARLTTRPLSNKRGTACFELSLCKQTNSVRRISFSARCVRFWSHYTISWKYSLGNTHVQFLHQIRLRLTAAPSAGGDSRASCGGFGVAGYCTWNRRPLRHSLASLRTINDFVRVCAQARRGAQQPCCCPAYRFGAVLLISATSGLECRSVAPEPWARGGTSSPRILQ